MTVLNMRALAAATVLAVVIAIGGAFSFASAATGGPTVTLTSSCSTATSTSPILVTATFSENVNALGLASIAVTNGTAANIATSTADTAFTFEVTPTAQGPVTIQIPADFASSTASSTGNVASNVITCSYDTAVPTITNVQVNNIGTSSADVAFDLNEAANATISYGTSTSYGFTATSSGTVGANTIPLSGLSASTTYHYMITASDTAGNTATTTDGTFTTSASTSSPVVLGIDSITTVDANGVADNLFSDGWKWVIRFTVPTNEDAFRIRFSDWGNASSSFAANGNMRLSIGQSSNASTTANGIIANGNGYSDWFYFTGDADSSAPGRQVDLTVEVKIPFGTANGSYSSNFTAQTFPSSATSTATSTP